MRLARPHRHVSIGLNMTPMIDIVFLLIIFFMTVTQISRMAEHPLALPRILGPAQADERTEYTINIDRQGRLFAGGRAVDRNQCLAEIAALRRPGAGGAPTIVEVLVRCDRDCPAEHVNALTARLSDLGVRQVRLGVIEGEP